MGRFNLNQILNDASRQAAEGGGNTTPRPAESEIKKISVFDLVPSEDNFYSMREIEELKAAIEIAGKVLHITKAGPRCATVQAGVDALVKAGAINSPDYWLQNYGKLQSLDLLLCALGGAV